MCNEIIEMTKSIMTKIFPTKIIPTNYNKVICKNKKNYIFYLPIYQLP